jgi:prepilin signal peptidase PulO-like enzyme (type II secretory pathway)
MFVDVYAYYAVMFSILIIIAAYDVKHKIIPDVLAFIFGLLAFVGMFFISSDNFFIFFPHIPSVLELFSGILMGLPFALLWLFSRGAWMGLGDAKLAIGIGYFLGLSRGLSALALAFWIGAIIGSLLMLWKKGYGMKSELPFALYMVLGTFLAFVFDLHIFTAGF